jgi:hypothetical protein
MRTGRRMALVGFLSLLVAALTAGPSWAFNPDTEVSVGSNDSIFSQNKQNEPAVAIDANHPNILAAGANDNIDLEACNAGNPSTCPFTPGVGVSGIYFSFDSGTTWTQPTYSGWTARHCVGPPGFTCTPRVGPIGTLPWYYEEGLASGGDPALAFGPRRGANGSFSWANGSRLYYANLTANFSTVRSEQTFRGQEAIYVSRTDNVQAAAAGDKNAWMRPVLVSKQNAALFSDKEQIWADNAASSPFFGNVYVCNAAFRSLSRGQAAPEPIMVAVSRDGGDTWKQHQISPAGTNAQRGGPQGCTVRTDSHGVVYVLYTQFQVGTPGIGAHVLVKSFDGGHTWTRPRPLFAVNDACFYVDPVILRCVEDGVAGARNDLAAAPSVDIANGAPTGADATNEIVDAWVDGRDGLNHEHVMVSYSTNGGTSWSAPRAVESAGDRGYYAAPALSPDGRDLYVVYNAFTTPFRTNTTDPRGLVGVVLHANIGAGGAPSGWTVLHRGAVGDPRGSSQNNLQAEFLGDYVYAAATRTYGAAVWNDARNAAVCPAINAWRAALRAGSTAPAPAPNVDCPATFGNTDIFGGTYADPTTP